MLRASFTDGQLDRGKVASIVQSLIEKKPRHCIDILQNYKRLLRLEIEKRHATIESAAELSPEVREQIVSNLKRKYGTDLTIKFVVNPQLIGGMRVRLGSNVWDGSIQNRLQRLARQI
jgi:F-type H+-transporting ATPase subunit delta